MFRVGQKVVCVDDSNQPCAPYVIQRRVYTVAALRQLGNGLGIYVEELPDIETDEYYGAFLATRFRPIVERPTDISIFTAMLNPEHSHV